MTRPLPSRGRAAAADRDRADPLAGLRDRFHLPAGKIYLDGNSLGPVPKTTARRLEEVLTRQWGEDLIGSWERHGWIELPRVAGRKIARLIGAAGDEVVVCDSTSVNLFKTLAAALQLRPGRRVVVSDPHNFPTDLYIARAAAELWGPEYELRLVADEDSGVPAALNDEVAVVCLSHVRYRSGALCDMAELTRAAHDCGALIVWDLAHSVGTMEIDLTACEVDLAVGCGYKFLNGGPGAPAFLYVARRLQESIRTPLPGWLGHAEPFAFDPEYRPAPGVDRFLCGTPPILSLAALDAALDAVADVDLAAVRRKSVALGDLFLDLVARECAGLGLGIASPIDGRRRGAQVSLRHPHGREIIRELAARGVVGDFRPPDVLRFGLAPFYLRYTDVWDAVERLREVLVSRPWE